ncbi:MAG: UDP-2,3-diacylglucosamine diphosphatase LpxI, partial [Hyphomonadaceae bacterium]|nr:UDP-2,3-diacylglucosamine diphosphatase LpxI [Hyphomonadaceae bacterium]
RVSGVSLLPAGASAGCGAPRLMRAWSRLGLVAGAGLLPLRIAQHCAAQDIACFVARLPGETAPELAAFPGATFPLGELGARFAALHAFGVDAVVIAGKVQRPDFKALQVDAMGLRLLPRFLAAAARGDDALHRLVVEVCEGEGFQVLAVEQVLGGVLAREGPLGARAPSTQDRADIAKGAGLVAALGPFDVGQGCVIREGMVLAVEAQEGTDAMLQRVALLQRGAPRGGVLLKRTKPAQERRIDLPAIGLDTIAHAHGANLAGVAIEAGGALIIDAPSVRAGADAAGLFVCGVTLEN